MRPRKEFQRKKKKKKKKKKKNVSVDFWPVKTHAAAQRFDHNCDEKQKAKKQTKQKKHV